MKKRFLILSAVTLAIGSLIVGGGASASTITSYGNYSSGRYAYSYTQAAGSWASTTMYATYTAVDSNNIPFIWTKSFGYAYGASGYAQTPTEYTGLAGYPSYSTHSCDTYTLSKSF